MVKKISCIILTFILIFAFTGCAKCISTETFTAQVKIVDEYYREAYTTMYYSPSTKTMLPQPHSAIYRITVEYDGIKYGVLGRDTYNKYSDKVGEYTNGLLRIKKYDDGTVKYDVIGLE